MLFKNSGQIETSIDPYKNLWADVLNLAVKDLENINKRIKKDAINFFKNKESTFVWICEHLDLNSDNLRNKVLLCTKK